MKPDNTPSWINNLHQPAKTGLEYPQIIDSSIADALHKLTLEELNILADKSGVRDSLGVLSPPQEWSRDQYIEILSDISEMTDPQIDFIYKFLNIKS